MDSHWSTAIEHHELRTWAEAFETPADAWEQCPRADWLLWALSHFGADRPTLLLSACDCARTVLPHAREEASVLQRAVETVEAWAVGRASGAECRSATSEIRRSFHKSHSPLVDLVQSTLDAAIFAAQSWDARNRRLDHSVARVAERAAHHGGRLGHHGDAAALIAVVRARRHPLRIPSLTEVQRSDAIAVAWDHLSEAIDEEATLSVTQVLCSYWTALELGLDPEHPLDPGARVIRAVAERLQLAPHLVGGVRQAFGLSPFC